MNMAIVALLVGLAGQVRVLPEDIGPKLVGKRIVVEGVFAGSLARNGQQYLLVKLCKQAKLLARDLSVDKLSGNLEIVGDVRLDDNDLVVDIVSIKPLPTDLEQFQAQAQSAGDDPAAWVRVGTWAEQRARRYEIPALAEKAAVAYRTAARLHRRQAGGDPVKLRQLKESLAKDSSLPSFDPVPLEHELLHAEYRRLPKGEADARLTFAGQVRRRLGLPVGAPTTRVDAALGRRYDADPIATFDEQEPAERLRLVRYWEVAILRQALDEMAASGTRNPLALAELAEKDAPDYPEVTQQWLERATEAFDKAPASFAVSQAEALARMLVHREQSPEKASKVLIQWLRARETQLEAEDRAANDEAKRQGRSGVPRNANELFALAGLYLKWLKGPGAAAEAARLSIEALSIEPGLVEAERTLERLGYRKDANGVWVAPGAGSNERASAAVASDAGPLRIGMTAEQVRAVMLQPESRARIVTRGDVVHQWVYRLNQVTIYVFLKEERGQLRVSAVKTQK